jgi:hypothetical protein
MDEKTKNTLDLLCADKIYVEEAADILGMPIEEVFELADDYVYAPTSEEVIEACEIERETLCHIKIVALQNLEDKVRGRLTKQLKVSEPSYRGLMASSYDLLVPSYDDVSAHKFDAPLGLKARPMEEFVITPRRGEYVQYEMPDSYYSGHTVTKRYGS